MQNQGKNEPVVVGVDVGREGSDQTVLVVKEGGSVKDIIAIGEDTPIISKEDVVDHYDKFVEARKESIKISRKQRRANKARRDKILRIIKKKIKAVRSQRKEHKTDALPIEAEV